MLLEKERVEIVEVGKKMSGSGLCIGTSGNLSIYDPETGYMLMSPSGIGYFETEPEDVVVMDLVGNIVEGRAKPSSEHNLHAAFYLSRPSFRGVIHTHSTYCCVFASLRRPIEAVHYAISSLGTNAVPCAEYTTFGTQQLADYAIKALGDAKAVLLANHGLIAGDVTLAKAYDLASNLEWVAEVQWRCESIGKPVILTDREMAEVRERMKTYGQKPNQTY